MAEQLNDPGPREMRVITPRRGLPNGRALVGALLITVAALGAFVAATSGNDGPNTRYLVLTQPVAAGTPISLAMVESTAMELSPELVAVSLTSTDGLEGAVALQDLRAGELLSIHDLIATPDVDGEPIGEVHELSFAIPLDRTPTGVVSGDRVTVLATLDARTEVAIEDAVVLAIDAETDAIGSADHGVLTLAIDNPESVMRVAHLTQVADITVVRSTRAVNHSYPAEVGGEDVE